MSNDLIESKKMKKEKEKKVIVRVTTKTGDGGKSGLANGERVSKASSFFIVIGALDELNSHLGLVAAMLGTQFSISQRQLYHIQDTLFYIGAELARSPKAKLKEAEIEKLEKIVNKLQEKMSDDWHTKFVLPGGTVLGGHLDVARTVCRRAERDLVSHSQDFQVSPILLKYLNRLSDYLYVLRCFINHSLEYDEREFDVK